MTTSTEKRKSRLRMVLLAAAALGSSSTMMSGMLASFAAQHSVDTQTAQRA